MSRLKRLIVEIHHRSLWQVLLIYVGGAWACFELTDVVTSGGASCARVRHIIGVGQPIR